MNDGGDFDIIFVSDDGNAKAYMKNIGKMPRTWNSLPFNESGEEIKWMLKKEYAINAIPRLLVFSTVNGALIDEDATDLISGKAGSRPFFHWMT